MPPVWSGLLTGRTAQSAQRDVGRFHDRPALFATLGKSRPRPLQGPSLLHTYRSDLLAAPTWTYVYDTHQLLQTFSDHVDFGVLNANKTTAFVITAVDVEAAC